MESWLSELGISVSSPDTDFSNGYLLGSILYRYNLQEDFGSFSTKPSYAESNLSKLSSTLSMLNIKLIPSKVLSNDPVYIKLILSKLFKALHTIQITSLKPVRGKSASTKSRPSRLDNLNPAQQRFDAIRLQQSEKALKDEKQQMEAIRQSYLKERQKQIDILKSNKMFMQQWENEGKKNWTKNQMRKTARVKHEENVNFKISNDKVQRKVEVNADHCLQVEDGILEFERNMIRLGIDHQSEQKDNKKKSKKLDIKTEAMITMAKIKERKSISMQATKEREVRQRNLIVEQKKNEKFDQYKRASQRLAGVLIDILGKTYKFAFDTSKIYSKKLKTFANSLKNLEKINKAKEDTWGKIEKERQEKILAEEKLKKHFLPQEKLKFSQKFIGYRRETLNERFVKCKSIMDQIFDIAEEGASYLKSSDKIPEKLWNDWLDLFKLGLNPAFKTQSEEISTKSDMQVLVQNMFTSTPEPNYSLINSYLTCTSNWSYISVANNHKLGDIIESIIPIAYPDDPDPPLPEGPHYMPLKLILLGPAFSGKKTQLKKLQENFGLKLIEMPKLLEDAKKVLERKADAEDPKKKKVVEEEPEVFVSTCLETQGLDELGRSKLIRARLRGLFGDVPKAEEEVKKMKKDEVKCLGYCLMNYPTNIQEAIDLERHLSCFIHPSERPEPVSSIKKKEALLIAKPSNKPPGPKKMFRSAWDLVILLDVDLKTCTTRAVDRRIDPAGNVYNMTYYPPPDNILPKCKTIEHPNAEEVREMYVQYETNKDSLIHWFSQFGTEYETNFIVVKSGMNIETVTELIKGKVSQILKYKSGSEFNTKREEEGVVNLEQAKELALDWERLRKEYLEGLGQVLFYIDENLNEFDEYRSRVKQEFFEFLSENDEKIEIFHRIQDRINHVILNKGVFSSAEIVSLEQEIDEAADLMWDVTIRRKDLALIRRQEVIGNLILTQKTAGLMHLVCVLLQVEVNKYYQVINLVGKYNLFTDAKEFSIKTAPVLKIMWQDWSLDEIGLPLLKSLTDKAKMFCVKTDEHRLETQILLERIENISLFASERLRVYERGLHDMTEELDLWIKNLVKLENSAINEGVTFT